MKQKDWYERTSTSIKNKYKWTPDENEVDELKFQTLIEVFQESLQNENKEKIELERRLGSEKPSTDD